MSFEAQISPFSWMDYDDGHASVTLYASEKYHKNLFHTRRKEGFTGSGYNWESLAEVFIRERVPHLQQDIIFDSEAGMFCAYSSNIDALRQFILKFKDACENGDLIHDLFSRVEPEKPFSLEDFDNVMKKLMNRQDNNQ